MARRTTLGRAAKGLPKFWLGVGWWTENGFAGCPVEVVAVWPCCVSHCHHHATDGRLPADVETLALVLSLRLRDVRKAVQWLVPAGKLDRDGDDLVMVGYADDYPTSVEVEAYTSERSKSGSKGNHERWHTGPNGKPKPDECVLCEQMIAQQSLDRSPPDRSSDPSCVAVGSHGMGWDGMADESVHGSDREAIPPATGSTSIADRGSLLWSRHVARQLGPDCRLDLDAAATEVRHVGGLHPEWTDLDIIADIRSRTPV